MPTFPVGYAAHFQAWMDRNIRPEDQGETFALVSAFLEVCPQVIDKGYTWGRILELAQHAASFGDY